MRKLVAGDPDLIKLSAAELGHLTSHPSQTMGETSCFIIKFILKYFLGDNQ